MLMKLLIYRTDCSYLHHPPRTAQQAHFGSKIKEYEFCQKRKFLIFLGALSELNSK